MLWKNKFGMINRKWFSCFWDGLTPPMREVFRGVGRFQLEFQLRGSQYHSTEAQEKVGCSLWAVSTTAVARQIVDWTWSDSIIGRMNIVGACVTIWPCIWVTTILNIKLQYELQFYPPVIKSMEWKTLYLSMVFPLTHPCSGGFSGATCDFFRGSHSIPGMWNWMCHKVDPPIIQSQEGTEVKLGFRRVPLKNILQLLSMTYITWWEAPSFRLKLPKPTR